LSNFDEIQRIIPEDPTLLVALTSAATGAELFAAVVAPGRERGIVVAESELMEIVRANRQACFERWLAL